MNGFNLREVIDKTLSGVELSQEEKESIKKRTTGRKKRRFERLKIAAAFAACFALCVCAAVFFGAENGTTKPGAETTGTQTQKSGEDILSDKIVNLMKGYSVGIDLPVPAIDEDMINAYADFSAELFNKSLGGGNTLISPLSVYMSLAMTANGASGNTLAEFCDVLAGGRTREDMGGFCYAFVFKAGERFGKFKVSNSIWYDNFDDFTVKESFLQKNASMYAAGAFMADLQDPDTIKALNAWVNGETDGQIDGLVDEISEFTVMYLVNTLTINANWKDEFSLDRTSKRAFYADGAVINTEFICNTSEYDYFEDADSKGLIIPLEGGKLSFAAILPNEGVSANEYIDKLDGARLVGTLKGAAERRVYLHLPKFTVSHKAELIAPLKSLGLEACFNSESADFSEMTDNHVWIGEAEQKTFFNLNEKGITAAAATKTGIQMGSPHDCINMTLDRPFIYMVIENETRLPLFIGIMQNPQR